MPLTDVSSAHLVCCAASSSTPWIHLGGVILQIASPCIAAVAIWFGLKNTSASVRAATKNAEATQKTNLDIAKRRATLDLILGEQTNPEIFNKRHEFIKLRDSSAGLVQWASEEHKSSDNTRCITSTINRYEMIAIGIDNQIICETIYKNWLRKTVILDWKAVRPFVMELRRSTGIESLYERFEVLATKWEAEG